jgi:hypothetical protein
MSDYAFPKGYDTPYTEYRGMTLRDYIAIQAMNGYVSAQTEGSYAEVASWSYEFADAMLKARAENTE